MRQRLDLMKDFFLEANPNPDRVGCPDEQTIRALAEDRLPPGNPARLHLASCSECFTEYRGFRGDWEVPVRNVGGFSVGRSPHL